MACDPGQFEKIAQTMRFGVRPVVLTKRDLVPVRYCFSEDVFVSQHSARSTDSDETLVSGEKQEVLEEKTIIPSTESQQNDSETVKDANENDEKRDTDTKDAIKKEKIKEKRKKKKHKHHREKSSPPDQQQSTDSDFRSISSLSSDHRSQTSSPSANTDRKSRQRRTHRRQHSSSSRSRSGSRSPSALSDHEMRKHELFTQLFTDRHQRQNEDEKNKKKGIDRNDVSDGRRRTEADYRAPADKSHWRRRDDSDHRRSQQSSRLRSTDAASQSQSSSGRGGKRQSRQPSGVFQELRRIYGAPLTSSSSVAAAAAAGRRPRTDAASSGVQRQSKHGGSRSSGERRPDNCDETSEDLGSLSVRN